MEGAGPSGSEVGCLARTTAAEDAGGGIACPRVRALGGSVPRRVPEAGAAARRQVLLPAAAARFAVPTIGHPISERVLYEVRNGSGPVGGPRASRIVRSVGADSGCRPYDGSCGWHPPGAGALEHRAEGIRRIGETPRARAISVPRSRGCKRRARGWTGSTLKPPGFLDPGVSCVQGRSTRRALSRPLPRAGLRSGPRARRDSRRRACGTHSRDGSPPSAPRCRAPRRSHDCDAVSRRRSRSRTRER